MPGTDGLSMISKDSWLARKALAKDYDHLQDADRLIDNMVATLLQLMDGHSTEAVRVSQSRAHWATWLDRLWAWSYRLAEDYTRDRLYADEACTGCGLCERICPVGNIKLSDNHPQFASQCMLCLRCLHACPQEAIQIGKLTAGKFRWKGPRGDFQPLRLRPEHEKAESPRAEP
jgi:ferredoxin